MNKIKKSLLNIFLKLYLKNLLGLNASHFYYPPIRDLYIKKSNKLSFLKELSDYLMHSGFPDEAEKCLKIVLGQEENYALSIKYIQLLPLYSSPEKYSHKYIYTKTKEMAERFIQPLNKNQKFENSLSVNRKLRIGYTCHFFDNSTSRTLLLPLLAAHNRKNVEIYVYSDQDPKITRNETKKVADYWRDIYGLDDQTVKKIILKDKIDILVELNGWCHINRYNLINMRAAPIQVSYYNIASTAGVEGLDYILVGDDMDIRNLQPYYHEKIYKKKGAVRAVKVSDYFPDVSPLPYHKNGFVTFGSFGAIHKVSREQVKLWCEVLKKVPNSKFYMKATALDQDHYYKAYKNLFSQFIAIDRIILEGYSPYPTELLKCYDSVDIALDSYPHIAGTTTVEATIMGVPTVALKGERMCSCNPTTNSLGLQDLMAKNKNDFIKKSVELAKNINKLVSYRKDLRNLFIKSPAGNLPKFINELEESYQDMWNRYCNK